VKFPVLYKKTSNGAIEQWAISVVNNEIITVYGHVGGKLQTASEVVREGKNIGRSNETTPIEQARAQAEGEWNTKKTRKGYVEDIAKAEAGENSGAGGIRPMLAQTFTKHGDKIEFPCYAQPKLDGIRCIAVVDDNRKVTLWSREQKPIVAVPSIIAALEALSDDFIWPGAVIDGELYNHALKNDFEKISSCVRKQYPASDAEQALVQYHVYDMPRMPPFGDCVFGGRMDHIAKHISLDNEKIVRVDTAFIKDKDALLDYFEHRRADGYEGAMARNDVPYEEGKRSYGLQKLKEFDEGEFPIVGVEEGVGKMEGLAIFVCTTGKEEFRCKMEGALDGLRKYLTNRKLWEGKKLTVKYQGLTGKNKLPRFPVGKAVRDYE
jgi:DNA ligase-1